MEITDPRRQVTLNTLPGGDIDVRITEQKEKGKSTTQRMTVKNVDELKSKDAEIGRIYEHYSRISLMPRFSR